MQTHLDRLGIVIRSAAAQDWPSVEALLIASGLPLDGAKAHFANFVVATRDDAVIGCVGVELHGDVGLLRSCAVRAEDRTHGIGINLVVCVIARAQTRGTKQLLLLTTSADRFFTRLGFETIDREQMPAALRTTAQFLTACPATATVMRRTLASE